MLLALDIGNSSVSAGLFEGDRLAATRTWPTAATDPARALGELPERPAEAVLAGVVPAAVAAWRKALGALLARVVLVRHDDLPMTTTYEPPAALGIDRLLAAYAARSRYGGPCLVADCGTATTLDAVDASGCFRGGAILCGLGLQRDALAAGTALLPNAELSPPPSWLGRNTVDCLRVGLIGGHAGAIAWLADAMREALGAPGAPLVGTGGAAGVLAEAVPALFDRLDPTLTLQGLRLVHQQAGEVPR